VASFSDFVDTQLQASIFTASPGFSVGPAINLFMSRWPERFQTVVFASEKAPGLPVDAPNLILQSKEARFRLQAGPSRLDILQFSQNDQDRIDVSNHFNACCDVFDKYLQLFPSSVSRARGVVRRVASETKPAAALSRHFLKDMWLQGDANIESADDLELNFGMSYLKDVNMQIVGWFRCRSASYSRLGAASSPPQITPVILVEQDLNTPFATSKVSLGVRDLRDFFSMVPEDLALRLAMYFP
jgi:hypothetical protein